MDIYIYRNHGWTMENGPSDNIWRIYIYIYIVKAAVDRPAAGSGPFHQAIGVGVGVQAIACHGKSALIESMEKKAITH